MDIIENLRYKLCCFGVVIDVPAEVFCYNKYVVKNSSVPASVLNKLRNSVCSHWLKESQARDMITVQWIPVEKNLGYFI